MNHEIDPNNVTLGYFVHCFTIFKTVNCIGVLEVSLQTRVRSRAVSQPAVNGSPIGWRAIGPVLYGLGEGLVVGVLLGSPRSSDSLWQAGRLQADLGCQVNERCFL